MISPSSVASFQLKPGSIRSAAGLAIKYIECKGTIDGPTSLFIHGLDSSKQTFQDIQQNDLSTPSIAIDNRGCGRSDLGNPHLFSPDALVEDVKCLVESNPLLHNNPFVLVGHSMGGRIAMSYAAKYPNDISTLVIEDMDIKRRCVIDNSNNGMVKYEGCSFIQKFDEDRAIKFDRRQETLDCMKSELKSIGYPNETIEKWINEGRIYQEKDGNFYSDVNPAFRALCYRKIFDSNNGEESWNTIAKHIQNGENKFNIHLMIAGIGSVCGEESINDMQRIIHNAEQGEKSCLSVKTYQQGTHSIHNSARDEFMSDLKAIIDSAR